MSNTAVANPQPIPYDQQQVELARIKLAANPRQMTMVLARQLNLPEEQVIRALPSDTSIPLDISDFRAFMDALAEAGEMHVIVSNGSATIEAVGVFGGFSNGGGFFNVQSDSLDMHIRYTNIAAAYAVRKPSHFDGHETLSIQFFDLDGQAAFKAFLTFGGSDPSAEKRASFQSIISQYSLA